MASAFDLGTPEALAPGAKTAGVVGNTQDKLAAFRSHASDDVVKKIREATKLLEQRQAAAAAAPAPPAEEDHPSYMEDAAKEVKALPEAHAPAPPEPPAPEPAPAADAAEAKRIAEAEAKEGAAEEMMAKAKAMLAAAEKAEGDKVLVVKSAEAEAESKYLSGVGVARQRKAIVDGLKGSIAGFTSNIAGTSPKDVVDLLLITQYFDMLRDIGSRPECSTVYIPEEDE